MFGLLKNKLSNFIAGLVGKEKEKEPSVPTQEKPTAQAQNEKKPEHFPDPTLAHAPMPEESAQTRQKPAPKPEAAKPAPKKEHPKPSIKPRPPPEIREQEPAKPEAGAQAQKPRQQVSVQNQEPNEQEPGKHIPKSEPDPFSGSIQVSNGGQKQGKKSFLDAVAGMLPQKKGGNDEGPDLSRLARRAQSEERNVAPRIGIGTAVKSIFSNEITIGEGDVSGMLEELELSLLEADVAYEVSTEVTAQLREKLIGMRVPKGEAEQRIKDAVKGVLSSIMDSGRKFDFVERVSGFKRPAKVLFVGPNGAGKTTTMAKVARMLMDAGLTVVFSASDTFRAAAIEQAEVHAGRLGVRVVKSKYGADPASVAFDAINFARANSVDVVLIDSAGRQDTNANLLSELRKIVRIAQPDLKIYIGESIGGNSVIGQIRAFNEAIGVDGAILTKIDCDAKGGTAISIAHATGTPVIFLGVGQGYSDLVPFDPEKIAQEIMS